MTTYTVLDTPSQIWKDISIISEECFIKILSEKKERTDLVISGSDWNHNLIDLDVYIRDIYYEGIRERVHWRSPSEIFFYYESKILNNGVLEVLCADPDKRRYIISQMANAMANIMRDFGSEVCDRNDISYWIRFEQKM